MFDVFQASTANVSYTEGGIIITSIIFVVVVILILLRVFHLIEGDIMVLGIAVLSAATIFIVLPISANISESNMESEYYKEKIEESYNVEVVNERIDTKPMIISMDGVYAKGCDVSVDYDGKKYDVYLIANEDNGKASLYKKNGTYNYSFIHPKVFKEGTFDSVK